MSLSGLTIEDFRNIHSASLAPGPGLNRVLGVNGAGKTSVLEALYFLGRGRSFRPGRPVQLIREGQDAFQVTGRVTGGEREHQVGIRAGRAERVCRLDGEAVESLATLAGVVPVLVFEPHSHELVEGGPEQRRRFLDWGVFHVEHEFLGAWRRYRRALRQRNVALRQQDGRGAGSWEPELAKAGELMGSMRSAYAARLGSMLSEVVSAVAPSLEGVAVNYRAGWDREQGLEAALRGAREQDSRLGYSHVGPHRDELRISLRGRQAARRLSRGQEKLVALALVLAQARLFREDTARAPILLLDDLPSELDAVHLQRSVRAVSELESQVFVTAVEDQAAFDEFQGSDSRFHVEHGKVTQVV